MIRRTLSIAALLTVVVLLLAGRGHAQGCAPSPCRPDPALPTVTVDPAGLPHDEPGGVLMDRAPRHSAVTQLAAGSGLTLLVTTLLHVVVRRRRAIGASAMPAMEPSVPSTGRRGRSTDPARDRPSPVGSRRA